MPSVPTVGRILTATAGGLQELCQRAEALEALTQRLRQHLGTPLGDHIAVANIRNDTAVIATDAPTWLTKLRYQAPQLLELLQQGTTPLEPILAIQFKILPAAFDSGREPFRRPAAMSGATAALLANSAEGTDDPRLAAALRRLARHGGG